MYKLRQQPLKFFCFLLIAHCLLLSSCNTIDLYERIVSLPARQWQSNFKPQFSFTIKDTVVSYQFYIILRHNNQYKYNNIWVNLSAKTQNDTLQKLGLELPLANKEGWLGTGMDDIFEHRIRVADSEIEKLGFVKSGADGFHFTKPGEYTFTLEQIMREDPLMNLLDIGIRLEKKTP